MWIMEPAWRLLSARVAWSSLGQRSLQSLAHEDELDLVDEDAFFVLDGLLDGHDLVIRSLLAGRARSSC
jgi:hypothetical protein